MLKLFSLKKEGAKKIAMNKLYKIAEEQISDEHPIKCVCGRLCTGLHEITCKKFREAVERRYKKLVKNQLKT